MILDNKNVFISGLNYLVVAVIFVLFGGSPAVGQIVLDRDYFESLLGAEFEAVEYLVQDASLLQPVVDAAGEDAEYDFTVAEYDTALIGTTILSDMPGEYPGSDEEPFDQANIAAVLDWEVEDDGSGLTDSTAWGYFGISDEAYDFHGFVYLFDADEDGEQDTLRLSYEPGLRNYELPVEYGDSWETSSRETLSFFGFTFEDTVRHEYEVEGWGQLITSWGSAPALRVRQTEYTAVGTDSADTTVYLNFETRQAVSAVIELDNEGNPVDAWYTVEERKTTDIADDLEVPREFELAQNYPNPFNPTTVIQFSLPETESVTLSIYDPLGRRVQVLDLGSQMPGTHRVRFDASSLTSGVYLYRIEAGDYSETRQMVLIR